MRVLGCDISTNMDKFVIRKPFQPTIRVSAHDHNLSDSDCKQQLPKNEVAAVSTKCGPTRLT